jgi:hypothetical protein
MENRDSTLHAWLLETENPSVRYRTLRELLHLPDDEPRVVEARRAIADSEPVRKILSRMEPNGTWLQKNPRTKRVVGEGVEYGSFATTHFCLGYLAELGLDVKHPDVAKAADRYLDLQAADGDFWDHLSCLYSHNIRTFVMLGLGDDPRVRKTIALMLGAERPDGGYLCDLHEGKRVRRATKSCFRGSAKALMAFAVLPEYDEHPRCKSVADYFLGRECLYRKDDRHKALNHDVMRLVFPFTWRAGMLDILLGLSALGYGRRVETRRAWQALAKKRDEQGRYVLDWTPSQALLKVGKRGAPCKWTTFYALLALKMRDSAG